MAWEYRRRVKYYETDRMGVVHHSNYLRIIEDARMEWLRDNLTSYREMEEKGIIIPAISASENFKGYLHFDDPFKVAVKLVSFKGVKMTFSYEIINTNNNELCYEGISSHFFAVDKSYKPYLNFRKDFPHIYNKIKSLLDTEKTL